MNNYSCCRCYVYICCPLTDFIVKITAWKNGERTSQYLVSFIFKCKFFNQCEIMFQPEEIQQKYNDWWTEGNSMTIDFLGMLANFFTYVHPE